MATHYGTLGVADGAPPEDVRRAYLDLARQLHPDRWIDASERERGEVDERMREVNEAWRVLGNPARRLAYDVELREAGRRARAAPPTGVGERFAFSTGDLFTEDVAPPDAVTRVLRAVPWIILFVGLAAIFVFTAYAGSDDSGAPGDDDRCIQKVGGAAVDVDCGTEGSQRVIVEVLEVGDCPLDSEPFQPAGRSRALCLAPPD